MSNTKFLDLKLIKSVPQKAKRVAPFLLALCLGPLLATAVNASGGGGGFSGSSGGGGGFGATAPRKPVDETYEFGKSVYLGRAPGSTKIKYCVNVEGEPKKLRGRTLRSYKGTAQTDFANALVNCAQPDQLALAGVDREQIAYVIYYLNKRYDLDLASR